MTTFESAPIVTLTTDFGLTDHYVGTMKGVILSRCPGARVVDITHGITPFTILEGAYAIDQAAPYFPSGTIHVVVIDPGVGTDRKGLAVAARGQIFVAPDNGVLGLILARDPAARAFELTNRGLWLPETSATFHGRDIFAAVAGALANGSAQLPAVGPEAKAVTHIEGLTAVEIQPNIWRGLVLSVDHFGNVITNLPAKRFPALSRRTFSIRTRKTAITRFSQTFGAAETSEPFAYFGSSGFIELALNQRSLAALSGIVVGDEVVLDL